MQEEKNTVQTKPELTTNKANGIHESQLHTHYQLYAVCSPLHNYVHNA